jgi:protease II
LKILSSSCQLSLALSLFSNDHITISKKAAS